MGGYIPTSHFKPEWPVYPPSTFFFCFLFSLLPWSVLSVVWLLLSFGFLSAAMVVLLPQIQSLSRSALGVPFVILLADGSIGWAVQLGQPTLIAASSLTLAIVALESGAMPLGGLFLAISLCLKPQGAYLCAAYFLLKTSTRIPAWRPAYSLRSLAPPARCFFISGYLRSLTWDIFRQISSWPCSREETRIFRRVNERTRPAF